MPTDFLKKLPLTEEEAKRLASLGASSPLALLEMRKASPDAFDTFLGKERVQEILKALETLLTEEERKRLAAPYSPQKFPLGARLGEPGLLPEPPYDVSERDRLFAELEALRRQPETSEIREKIATLKAKLDRLLDGR